MKKYLLLLLCALFLLNARTVNADDASKCTEVSNFQISNPVTGPYSTTTNLTVTATLDCINVSGDGNLLRIDQRYIDDETYSESLGPNFSVDGNGVLTATDVRLPRVGDWSLEIWPVGVGASTPIDGYALKVTIADEAGPPIACGDTVTNESTCPNGCPGELTTEGDKYVCKSKIPDNKLPEIESDPPPCTAEISTDGCISVYSAFGNFSTSPEGFLTKLFSILLSVSGGIALLFIIRSGYQLMTSQGDPEKVKEARERITSAIVGLLFLVFSLVILEVIGVDILAIPGLNR